MLTALFFASYIALVLGSVPLWRRAILQIRNHEPILRPRKRISSPFGLSDVAIMFFTWFAGQVGSATLAVLILGIKPGEMDGLSSSKMALMACIVAIGQVVSTAFGMLLVGIRYGRLDIFGVQPDNLGKDVAIGVHAFLMVVPGLMLLQWSLTFLVPYEHATLEMLTKDHSVLTIAATWFAAVLVAAVCEEIFFRGVLQSWLQRLGHTGNALLEQTIAGGWGDQKFVDSSDLWSEIEYAAGNEPTDNVQADFEASSASPIPSSAIVHDGNPGTARFVYFDSSTRWMPIFASAAVFALAHVGQGAAPIPLFVFGLALGYLYRQTGSIMPCIVLHMGLNGYSMFWFTLQLLFPDANVPPPISPSE